MPTRRTAAVLVSIGLVAGGCTSAPPPSRPPGPVPIGLLAEAAGGDAQTAAELAVEVVNGSYPALALPLAAGTGLGRFGGAELTLAVADTGGEAAAAGEAARGLHTRHGVAGLVAADRLGAVETVAGYANQAELPVVDAATSADYLLDLGLSWYFRTSPSDRQLMGAAFDLLAARGEPDRRSRVTTLTPSVSRGADVATRLATQAEAVGFTATGSVAAGTGADGRLAGTDPDIVVAIAPAAGDGPGLYETIEGWRALGPATLDPSTEAAAVAGLGPGFVAASARKEAPAGMLYPAGWSAELAGRTPLTQAVAALHQQRYGAPLTAAGAHTFTAVLVLAMALDAAGSTEPAGVRAGLRQLSVPATQVIMPWNGIRFGEDGQNELAAAVVEQATGTGGAAAGGIRLVYPPELAETDPVWP